MFDEYGSSSSAFGALVVAAVCPCTIVFLCDFWEELFLFTCLCFAAFRSVILNCALDLAILADWLGCLFAGG